MTEKGQPTHYLPGLDGLRTISIGLVLLSHVKRTAGAPTPPSWWWHLGDTGNLGVRVFFVISGFLITHLLLREEAKTGHVSLPRFYLRRAFRILPALWGFLVAMLILRAAGLVIFPTRQLLQGAFFFANYHVAPNAQWSLGHLWSLSVEEQFYFLWPAIVAFAPRSRRLHILGAAVVVAPLLRLIGMAWASAHGQPVLGTLPNGFFTAMDSLAMGCFVAVLRNGNHLPALYQRMVAGRWVVVLPIVLLLLNGLTLNPWIFLVVMLPLMNLTTAVVVELASRGTLLGWQRLLDLTPMRWVGRLSYSLYLWQQPFLDPESHQPFARFPINLAAAFVAATVSFYLIERPVLARRPN